MLPVPDIEPPDPVVVKLLAIALPVALIKPAVRRLPPCTLPATVSRLVALSKVKLPVAPALPALLNMT
jgi:hypothetical protein